MKITTPILNAIRRSFAPEDAEQVIYTLENTPDFLNTWEFERIQFAILVYAQGSLERFTEALALTNLDWRDILVTATLSGSNWPKKVLKTGLADQEWCDQTMAKIQQSNQPSSSSEYREILEIVRRNRSATRDNAEEPLPRKKGSGDQ